MLFTNNENNRLRLFGEENPSSYVRDAFHAYLVNGAAEAVNPAQTGTKSVAYYRFVIPPGKTQEVRLRLRAAQYWLGTIDVSRVKEEHCQRVTLFKR